MTIGVFTDSGASRAMQASGRPEVTRDAIGARPLAGGHGAAGALGAPAHSESGTLLLASVSALALVAARWESTASVPWLLIPAGLFLAVPWLVWSGLRYGDAVRRRLEAAMPLMIAAWLALPLVTNWLQVALSGLVAVALFCKRVACCDWLLRGICWLAGLGSARRRVLWTVRLLELRSWLAGSARPPQAPLTTWYGRLSATLPPLAADGLRLTLGAAERLLYGPETQGAREFAGTETAQACSIVARQVGVGCFRGTFSSGRARQVDTKRTGPFQNFRRATRMARTMGTTTALTTALVLVLLLARQASACPFCTALSNTLTDDLKDAAAGILAEQVGVLEAGTAERLPHQRFRIVEILKGPDRASYGSTVDAYSNLEFERGQLCLLLAYDESADAWVPSTPLTPEAAEYLRGLPRLRESGAERLAYFLPYLDHPDRLIADDAYNEFARASLAEVEQLADQLDRDWVVARLRDTETALHRRRLYWTLLGICGRPEDVGVVEELLARRRQEKDFDPGLDAAVACYLTLGGEPALRDVEQRYLRDPQAEYSDTYSAIQAIRVHGTELTRIPQERLAAALRQVLSRPALADLVIADLARWEDWSVVDRLYELFVTADEHSQYVKEPVVNYLRVCPLPEAEEALRRLRSLDPETVRRAETLSLFSGLGAPPVPAADMPGTADTDPSHGGTHADTAEQRPASSPSRNAPRGDAPTKAPLAPWWLVAGVVATCLLVAAGKLGGSLRRKRRPRAADRESETTMR